MKKILFLIRDDIITIRRFLLVAQELNRQKAESIFLDMTNGVLLKKKVKSIFEELKLSYFPEYILFEEIIIEIDSIKADKFIFMPAFCKYINTKNSNSKINDLEELLKKTKFNSEIVIKEYYKKYVDWWEINLERAIGIIEQLKPGCIIYDLEIGIDIRAFLLSAQIKKVNIFSMQHAEGWADQYSSFPRFADYYIAYSPYNVDVIKKLDVSDKNIFLTGCPDTDIIYNYNITKIKEEIKNKIKINYKKKILLVALKPSNPGYINENIRLMDTIFAKITNKNEFMILIKPHPIDDGIKLNNSYITEYLKNKEIGNIITNYAISKLLIISDYFITHISSCIVESILLKVNTIVIQIEESGAWPDWSEYNLYNSVPFSELENSLVEIKNNEYSNKYDKKAWEEFIKRFRYKYDNRAAKRIAGAIANKAK